MPNSVLNLEKLSEQINKRDDTVIAVAEGYGKHPPHDVEKRFVLSLPFIPPLGINFLL